MMPRVVESTEILLIHMGGLGDVCLSESLFFSFSRHFKNQLVACGIRRFFSLFSHYFIRIENIESARWLFLFSNNPLDINWERIIFIGKDREGSLRERLSRFSRNNLIFIDMYPEYNSVGKIMHVEDYQLQQLERYLIKPFKKEIEPIWKDRIIIYPEKGFTKKKWGVDNFLEIYRRLKDTGLNTFIMEPFDMELKIEDAISIRDLKDVKDFFIEGGIFVSNDSGMAHLAGACGMSTITLFTDFDPEVWHPRGKNISLKDRDIDIETVLNTIFRMRQH